MRYIQSSGVTLATYTYGKGSPVIFLHGGPGDTHHYMKRMAEPLFDNFQCIFFDQRGTGDSKIENRAENQLTLDLMIEDLHAVQNYYSSGPVQLVGHSWGAMYGLFACMKSPERFSGAALLNMGPLDSANELKSSENLLNALNSSEKNRWTEIRKRRNFARDNGDINSVLEADKELMYLRVKSWIFDPDLHETFLKDYFQDPPPDREVNKWVWNSLDGWFKWEQVKSVSTPIWLCVGGNDSTPIEQAQLLKDKLPQAQLSVYENCGHIPWLEHPEKFYADLKSFLKGKSF